MNPDKKIERGGLEASWGGKSYEATAADLIRPDVPMEYVSLHHHSTYSYLDGFGLPSAHIRRAAELGMSALALTEHGNVSSHAKLSKSAYDFGVKPLYGCELYCGQVDIEERTQRKNHLTVLAKDAVGYRNLLRVVSQGWSDFYYEPTVSGETLAKYKNGLVILSGCTGSLLATSLVGGKNIAVEDASETRGTEVARRFKRVFGDNYFLEVQMFPELESVRSINQSLERISRLCHIPLVATGDCHYTMPDESELQQVLHSVGRHRSLEQLAQNWSYDVKLSPPLDDQIVYDRLRGTGLSHMAALEARANTALIAAALDVEVPAMAPIEFPLPAGMTREELWKRWLREGWDFRRIGDKRDKARYVAQVKKELNIIESKGFVDYFLIVSDLVKFAKDNNIPVGPARGSAAASLVCYLLRITEVDPMLFPNLIFERFIDYTRDDLPDIDLDFDDERRHEVFEYAAQRYGREFVGKIGTFTTYKAKNALDDIAYVHGVPKWEVEKVKEMLIERSSGDLRASATIEDTVEQYEQASDVFERYPMLWQATALEGNVKGMGIHAAGLVVATKPIRDVCAVYVRTDHKGRVRLDESGLPMEVISWDKYDAEEHNLLKVDLLGLANMGMIRLMCEMLNMSLNDVYNIPLDDKKTLQGFYKNDCVGIFQFDGWAMRLVNGQLKPTNFNEVCDVNALARPGPLHSNATAEYVEVRRGQREPSLKHPLLDPIVANTYGQIIYQEQILRIVREIGGFDWTHASYIRRIISRKIGEQEFNRQKDAFITGASAQGMDEATIDKIWGACITAGAYAFNAAHSVSYGMLGFWTMWFKQHHPQAFFTAALQKLKAKQKQLLRDAVNHGITIRPPHYNESEATWRPAGVHSILAGFDQIPRVGGKLCNSIIQTREEMGGFEGWHELSNVYRVGRKTCAAMEAFCEREDPFDIFTLEKNIKRVTELLRRGRLGRLPIPTHKTIDVPMDRGHDTYCVWIGTIHSRNVRDLFEINFSKTGEALDITTVRSPELAEWVIMFGEDETEQMSVTVDRFRYPSFKKMVWNIELDRDLVLVEGVKKGYQARRALYVRNMWVIDPEED
ncbi:MAG TPA: DNA polymerase III subunit alpha [Ktedonobacteraceae bacterium]